VPSYEVPVRIGHDAALPNSSRFGGYISGPMISSKTGTPSTRTQPRAPRGVYARQPSTTIAS
jgi:hypothetical protein